MWHLLPLLCFIVSFKNILKRKQWSGLLLVKVPLAIYLYSCLTVAVI